MNSKFGEKVREQALKLEAQGKDANQIAKILCDKDNHGHNYGIGVILDGKGQPMATSSTLRQYAFGELGTSTRGNYMNSAKIIEEVKTAVLAWQRIPEKHWDHFKIALPSDAGTGAVKSAVEVALMLDSNIQTIGIEELGWPAHKAIAKVARIPFEEFPTDGVINHPNTLPIYQAGPMNTTGMVRSAKNIIARAKAAASAGTYVVLDRAYPGFEFARYVTTKSYDWIMRKSYELQIKPYVEHGVHFCMAISPTKSFVTFALRPCGILLVFCPDSSSKKKATGIINATIRARGSSFEHPITRAFANALVKDLPRLEAEHKTALERLAEAKSTWCALITNTAIETIFTDNYAGLFRNPKARKNAAINLYNEHIYPVITETRCRLNVTGIPLDKEIAQKHVALFAEYCYED